MNTMETYKVTVDEFKILGCRDGVTHIQTLNYFSSGPLILVPNIDLVKLFSFKSQLTLVIVFALETQSAETISVLTEQ